MICRAINYYSVKKNPYNWLFSYKLSKNVDRYDL